MSQSTDVLTLTQNTRLTMKFSAAIDRVKIANNSSFYLKVYFGSDAPLSASDPSWHDTIDPGDVPLLWIVGGSSDQFANRNYVASTPFLGTITLLPFLPIGAAFVTGGVITGASFAHATGYFPGEAANPGQQAGAYVQAAKQGRYQETQGGCERLLGNVDSAVTVSGSRVGGAIALTTANAPNLFTANATGPASVVNIYVYSYYAVWTPNGAGNNALNWHMELSLRNAAETVTRATVEYGRYKAGDAFTHMQTMTIQDASPRPWVITLVVATGTMVSGDLICNRWFNDGVAGAQVLVMQTNLAVDFVNQTALMELPYQGTATSGLSLPFSSFNPQTW